MTQNETPTILLLWNPVEWSWPELDNQIVKLRRGETVEDRWNCGVTKNIRKHSRFYLMRTANEGGGIVAKGTVASNVYRDKHWQEEKAQAGQMANFVQIRFSALSKTPFLTRDDLRRSPVNWSHTPQQSGTTLSPELALQIDRLWNRQMSEQGEISAGDMKFRFPEGARVFGFRPESWKADPERYAAVVADCIKHNCLPMGWGHEVDLSNWNDKVRRRLSATHSGQAIAMLEKFRSLKVGDFVFMPQGMFAINGIGRVTVPYQRKPDDLEELRSLSDRDAYWWNGVTRVEWIPHSAGYLGKQPWRQDTFFAGSKKVVIDKYLIEKKIGLPTGTVFTKVGDIHAADDSGLGEVGSLRRTNLADELPVLQCVYKALAASPTHAILLFGPAGTGKTFSARGVAREYTGMVETVQFHPAYAYEDFIIGLKAEPVSGGVSFKPKSGVFKAFCDKAHADKSNRHLFVIDEINRGNIAKVFGELMYCLEYRVEPGDTPPSDDKGKPGWVKLPYADHDSADNRTSWFAIPKNVHILGTMNSSDRSIATLDVALRRRFQFVELTPDASLLENVSFDGLGIEGGIGSLMECLNDRILKAQGRHKLLGHSYFMPPDFDALTKTGKWDADRFKARWFHQILPLLEEYFVDDLESLRKVIGTHWEGGELPKDSQHFVPVSVSQMDNRLFLKSLQELMSLSPSQDAQSPIEEE